LWIKFVCRKLKFQFSQFQFHLFLIVNSNSRIGIDHQFQLQNCIDHQLQLRNWIDPMSESVYLSCRHAWNLEERKRSLKCYSTKKVITIIWCIKTGKTNTDLQRTNYLNHLAKVKLSVLQWYSLSHCCSISDDEWFSGLGVIF